jgi:maleate isomerase
MTVDAETGRQLKLGLLIPSANTMLERDAQAVLPPGVTAHFARMKLTRDEPEQLAALIDHAPAAAELLHDAGVDAIAFACTTGSLTGGLGYDGTIIERLTTAAAVPVTTTATAVIDALRAVQARSVALVTPYEPWLNDQVVTFLEGSGFEVCGRLGFGLPDPADIAAVAPSRIVDAVRAVDTDAADAVLISCTAFHGLEAVRRIGTALGKPVLSSNQVTLWKLAQLLGMPSVFATARDADLFRLDAR